jgi:multidrug transporter EmrE-like cation transporter
MSHVCKEYISIIKWLGTILCLAGIGLTSFNIYPINIVLSLIGSVLWTFAGWAQKDTPLFLVELVAVIFYIAGIITLFN